MSIQTMQDKVIPVSSLTWDDVDICVINLYGVTFLEDFGVFKLGEKHECVTLDYQTGSVTVFDDSGTPTKTQQFKATPV